MGFFIKIPVKKTYVSKEGHKSSILEKDIEGYVIENVSSAGITKYQVRTEFETYNIHPDSYETKGKRYVYIKDDSGHWLCYDRPCREDRRKASIGYIPFRPKFKVKGNIIRNDDDSISFKIKMCWNEHNIDQYNELIKSMKDESD